MVSLIRAASDIRLGWFSPFNLYVVEFEGFRFWGGKPQFCEHGSPLTGTRQLLKHRHSTHQPKFKTLFFWLTCEIAWFRQLTTLARSQ
jgi:hypothetical protein